MYDTGQYDNDDKMNEYFNINWKELFSPDAEDPELIWATFIELYNEEQMNKFIPKRLCKLNNGSTRSKYPQDVIKLITKKQAVADVPREKK